MLKGELIPETLDAIDSLWKRIWESRLISRMFVDRVVQPDYADDIREGQRDGAHARPVEALRYE